jgi:multicomponent Na+:H+ antiporter subunit E
MQAPGVLIGIWLFYLLLSDRWNLGNLMIGLAIAFGITALLRPRFVRLNWRSIPAMLWALARYSWVILYDMLTSGIQVARLLLSRRMDLLPGIIAIPSGCQSELGTALSAHAITLSPGELVVEMDEQGVMYTHCLDVSRASQHLFQAQELRRTLLSKIFR